MGVQLDGTKITEVLDGSRAKEAGIQTGDVILAIDGEATKTQGMITNAIRGGGSKKTIRLKRGEETLDLALDWTNDPDEPRRLKQIVEREARDATQSRS
jgi:C-terminal processing protease CtpA/Prc